jgi:ABC-type molybdenum transport system ATPase subunit/photorepair protein PhrA
LPPTAAKRAGIMAAAPILSWEGLGLNQGTSWLFRDLDIQIGPRDRLALIGRNGAGKTTLLKLLSSVMQKSILLNRCCKSAHISLVMIPLLDSHGCCQRLINRRAITPISQM